MLNMSLTYLDLVFESPSFHGQGPSQIPGNLTPAMSVHPGLEITPVWICVLLILSPCLQDGRSSGSAQGPAPPVYPCIFSGGARREVFVIFTTMGSGTRNSHVVLM